MSSLTTFGLSATGLSIPRQSDFTADLQAQWQANFGQQVNLDPRSNNGQIISIMAERFALLAELLEAIYNASYPAGAEGVAVDNLLALQGLTRLAASPTRTAQSPITQTNGITLYGLLCLGTAGTVVPAGSLISDSATPAHQFSLDAAVTIQPAQNAVQTLVMNATPTTGTFALTLSTPSEATYTTPALSYSMAARTTLLTFLASSSTDSYGTFTLAFSNLGSITFQALVPGGAQLTGAQMAATINSTFQVSGVTGSGDTQSGQAGVVLDFGTLAVPTITASGPYGPTVTPSVQGLINGIVDPTTNLMPFTDVAVAKTAGVYTFTFGGNTVAPNQPANTGCAVPLITVASNSLLNGSTVVNLTVSDTVNGQPAQGVGSATATTDGPVSVAAGQLTTILNPVTGWSGVTNPLDCVAGTSAETDTEALARRASLVANQAQGPLASILQRVETVPGVTAALALTNDSLASQQVVTVGAGANTGSFALALAGQTTAGLAYNVTAAALQTALRALTGYSTASVTGTAASGLVVAWGNSVGGQSVPLMTLASNSTGVGVNIAFGRYPKSVEVVVEGGTNDAVAQAIFAAAPAGLATYGQPVLQTTATTVAGSSVITVLSVTGLVVGMGIECLGLPPGCLVTSIAGNNVTLSTSALSAYSSTPATFGFYQPLSDSAGNLQIVRFSRPTLVELFCAVTLVTDMYNVPGDATSGSNPASKFSVASVPTIQANVVAAINDVSIGGTISISGTDGVANAFRDVAGVRDASVALDTVRPPVNTSRLTLQSEQVANLQVGNVTVSFT